MADHDIEQWQKANEIYADLTEMTVSEAIAALHQLAHVKDEVKSLVMSLISAGQQSSHYFDQAMDHYRHAMNQARFEVGQIIGEYRLTKALDRGGSAEVFAAEKTDSDVQKPVAIKLFNHPSYSTHLSERFQIEQKVLADLSHPNIVKLYHGGHSLEGIPYMVMELVKEAKTIDRYVEDNQCSVRHIIRLMIQAGRAIAYAHTNLVVHRDIKPSNILMDDSGTLKVVDFGIAKLLNQPKDPQKTTLLALTPNYAAPEQIKSETVSVRTDVFSLAAVCLQLISGEAPLSPDRLLTLCRQDENHIHKLLKVSVKDSDLRKILSQALQTDPDRRYRHMDLFVDDLQAWKERRPVSASGDSWAYRMRKFAQRRTALFITSMALLLLALTSVGVFSWQYQQISDEAAKGKQLKEFLLNVFAAAKPEEARNGVIDARLLLAQAAENIEYLSFNEAADKSELMAAIAQAYFQLGLYDQAKDIWQQINVQMPRNSEALLGLAQVAITNQNYEAALNWFNQGRQSLTEAEQNKQQGELWLIQSGMAELGDNPDDALSLARKAVKYAQDKGDIRQQIKAARQVASLLYKKSATPEAIALLKQMMNLGSDSLPPTHPQILAIKSDLLDLYNDIGEFDQALQVGIELTSQIESVFGERHPLLIGTYISTAGTFRATGDMDKASEYAEKAHQLALKIHGTNSAITARVVNFLGVLSYVRGNLDQAIEHITQAANMYSESLGENHPDTWEVKTNLTALLNMNQEFKRAVDLLLPVYQSQKQALGANHKSTVYSQTILARLYGDMGEFEQAVDLGESVLENAQQALGEDHPLTLGAYFTLAKIYQKQGRLAAAAALIEGIIGGNQSGLKEDNEQIITAYNTLADLMVAQGNQDKAIMYKQKSWQSAQNILGDSALRTLSQRLKLALLLQQYGQKEAAKNHLRATEEIMKKEVIEHPGLLQLIHQYEQANQ